MDPNDVNSNINPAAATPAMPEMSAAPAPTETAAPVAPAMPEMPAAPAVPGAPVAPEAPSAPEMPAPVNPVVNPTGAPTAEPTAPAVPGVGAVPAMPEIPTPVSPVFQPGNNPMVGATDPITMPNPPKEPDPIEEELKAPMKAAGPVPGSIGSAISMPTDQTAEQIGQVPNVAFNDPATQQPGAQGAPAAGSAKKKLDKKTLIMLCALAGVVVVALAVVLIMQMQ